MNNNIFFLQFQILILQLTVQLADEQMLIAAVLLVAYVNGQTTPVPILKQINRVNDDGSYTYGFEAADGTFKVETRDNLGNVQGKYGYIDETGQLKTISYSAGVGFEATGDHIPVPVPASVPVQAAAPVRSRPVAARTTTTTPRPRTTTPFPARAVPPPAPVAQQHQPGLTTFLPTPTVGVPAAVAPVHRAPQQQFQQTNEIDRTQRGRGFSFSFEAPVFQPTQAPFVNNQLPFQMTREGF